MVHIGRCHRCDAEVNSMKLIHSEFHSDKLGYTLGGLLCEKCFLHEHGAK